MKFNNIALTKKIYKNLTIWDLAAISLILWLFIALIQGADYMYSPVPLNLKKPISLELDNLPRYAFMTGLRMFIGLTISIVFALVYGLLAAKVKILEKPLIAIIDVLQSIPILGYLSFTITGFIALFPGNILGFEFAVIFAIFTCQVWNIIYTCYQSIINLPEELQNISKVCRLNGVQKFFYIELPYAVRPIVWNMMISLSNAWFFVVASEAIVEGNNTYYLEGIGSYIQASIYTKNINGILWAIVAMACVLMVFDQLIFKPLVDLSNKCKYQTYASAPEPVSWIFKVLSKSKLVRFIISPMSAVFRFFVGYKFAQFIKRTNNIELNEVSNVYVSRLINLILIVVIGYFAFVGILDIFIYIKNKFSISEFIYCLKLGGITMVKISLMLSLTILLWLGPCIYIGMRPRLAKAALPVTLTLASFPANLVFPLCVVLVSKYNLNPDIWLSFLYILSNQWYIVFNIISGVSSIPQDVRDAIKLMRLTKIDMLKKVIFPAIAIDLLVGAITAWGSAWNSSIVVEFNEWGSSQIVSKGLGSYLTMATDSGEMNKIILSISVMVLIIEFFNRIFWRPLFKLADRIERLK